MGDRGGGRSRVGFLKRLRRERSKEKGKVAREREKEGERGNEEAVSSPSSNYYADKNASSSSPKDRTCLPLRFLLLSFSIYFLARLLSPLSPRYFSRRPSRSSFSSRISDATLGLSSRQLLNRQSPFPIRQSYRPLLSATRQSEKASRNLK